MQNDDFLSREITEEELSDWIRCNDIETGKPVSIKKQDIEAYEECVLDPDEQYRGPYKKGTPFTRVYTASNWYEIAIPYDEVMKIL